MRSSQVVTIERFIMEQERLHPQATGELTNLLYDIALASKVISGYVRSAGFVDVLGQVGQTNVQGEEQQKLDVFANEVMKSALGEGGRVCVLASEEEDDPILPTGDVRHGKYVVLYDPLDGSSNIDVNASIGTIFSVHRRCSEGKGPGNLEDCLRTGRDQVAAGYVIYGSSTMMVYTTGHGVHGFTLEPSIGEFVLSHPSFTTPTVGKYYSVNESNFQRWTPAVREVVTTFKSGSDSIDRKNARYIGSLVADFHRNLVSGGIFMYPADTKSPKGKLRLLYEAAPLAMVVENAGGKATNGREPILDIRPESLHERTPLIIGSAEDVAYATRVMAAEGSAVA